MKKNLIRMLLAAALLTSVGCSHDSTREGPLPAPGASSDAHYLAFALASADATSRAADDDANDPWNDAQDDTNGDGVFNPGRADETAISANADAHLVLFFDENGSFYGSSKLEKSEVTYQGRELWLAEVGDIEESQPAWMLVVVNADPARLKTLTASMEGQQIATALQWVTAAGETSPAFFEEDGTSYFTMTSSVFATNKNLSGDVAAAAPYGADETLADYIFESPEAAVEHPLNVYVERMVSKFTVLFQPDADYDAEPLAANSAKPLIFEPQLAAGENHVTILKNYTYDGDSNPVVTGAWRVHIVNWGINAVEPNTFLFKNLSNAVESSYPWTIDPAAAGFPSLWNTTDPATRPRSYWAVDQHYGSAMNFGNGGDRMGNAYPVQFRQSDELTGSPYEADPSLAGADGWFDQSQWALDYYPYSFYTNRSVSKYALENTFDAAELAADLAEDGHLRVGTHVLLLAQLVIDGFDEIGTSPKFDKSGDNPYLLEGVKTKYFSGGYYMTEETLIKYTVDALRLSLLPSSSEDGDAPDGAAMDETAPGKHVMDMNGQTYTASDKNLYIGAPGTTTPELLDLEDAGTYFELVPAQIKGGDGWVNLALKSDYALYLADDAEASSFTELSADETAGLIAELGEPAKAFVNGFMYYAIPVLHDKNFNTFDPAQLATGDVGVVRNHWYRMTINSIKMVGTPVHVPDQPIIPNHEPTFKYLGFQIEVLPWRVVDMGDVIL